MNVRESVSVTQRRGEYLVVALLVSGIYLFNYGVGYQIAYTVNDSMYALIGSAVSHVDTYHLLGNLIILYTAFLFIFLDQDVHAFVTFMLISVGSVLGNLVHILLSPDAASVIGASGGVLALFMYMAVTREDTIEKIGLCVICVLLAFYGAFEGVVALWAHAFGVLFGLVWAAVFRW